MISMITYQKIMKKSHFRQRIDFLGKDVFFKPGIIVQVYEIIEWRGFCYPNLSSIDQSMILNKHREVFHLSKNGSQS